MRKTTVEKIDSIRGMLTASVKRDPKRIAYMYKKDNSTESVSISEFYDSVEALGASLCKLSPQKTHIACVGENSYKWIQTYLTVLMSDSVFVPLDRELPVESLVFLINESDTEFVFCDKKRELLLSEALPQMPHVKKLISFDREEDDGAVLSFDKLLAAGRELDKREYDARHSDVRELKDLVYTSGTTGVAKGVMLSEYNLISSVYYGMHVSMVSGRCLSVLPYNHTYEAVCDILVSIHADTTLCINDSLRHVQDNLKLFSPTYIYLVPAFSEHFYNVIQKSIDKQGKRGFFNAAIKLSNALRHVGINVTGLLFGSIHKQFGGKLKKIVCGGAPIRPEIGKFFGDIGISLTGGYGITECSPLVSVNDDKDNNYASAGHRLPCLEWKISDPEDDGIGEIAVKGDVVMMGYYKRPDLTEEALRDGWFFTGDYGYINDKDEVVITGRKKNIIVLNNGKNVYPEEIEGYVGNVPYVKEVVVSGIKNEHGQDVGLSAEIYMDEELAKTEAELGTDVKNALAKLPSYKQITNIAVRHEPFPKTTTNKIKRQ